MSIQLELFTDADVQTDGYAQPETDNRETGSEQQSETVEGGADQ